MDYLLSNKNHHSITQEDHQTLLKIPNSTLHLIQNHNKTIKLANGYFSILTNNNSTTPHLFAQLGDEFQWPLTNDEPAVKLNDSYYLFTIRVPKEEGEAEFLKLGLSIEEGFGQELDFLLDSYGCLVVQESNTYNHLWVMDKIKEVEDNFESNAISLEANVEDYCGSIARFIEAGSGKVVGWILWCGVVIVGALRWGYEFTSERIGVGRNLDVGANTFKGIRWVKRSTKMLQTVAAEGLSVVGKVTGFFSSSIVNVTGGNILFRFLPGEIILASLNGFKLQAKTVTKRSNPDDMLFSSSLFFDKVYDTVEIAGKNVMLTTSVVTTGLISQRYGEQAGKAINELLDAVGYAIATAWSILKTTKAFNPSSAFKAAAAKASADKQKAN
ncbi:hypothetical protein ACFE04_011834 [Oxalis oulophora]